MQAMTAAGFTTYATFAFATNYQPGAADDSAFVKGVIEKVLGAADHPKAPAWRRLFYEAYTLVAAELKKKVDKHDEDKPKTMPIQERSARWAKLKARLVGMSFNEETEPSFQLIDAFAQQVDDGQIRYVEWQACTKRAQEVDGSKKAPDLKVWSPDSSGFLRQSTQVTATTISLSSDLKWRMALTRRGLAADVARWCKFETHECIAELLMSAWLQPPLPGYQAISFEQLARVDRAIFKRLAEECRSGIEVDASGETEIDVKMAHILTEPSIRCLLLPLPSGSGSSSSQKRVSDDQDAPDKNKFQKAKESKGKGKSKSSKGSGKSGGRSESKSSKKSPWKSKDPSGALICFPYNNAHGCTRKECGMKHICARCYGDHSASTCNK